MRTSLSQPHILVWVALIVCSSIARADAPQSPQLALDEAMKLFEEGVELSRECQKQLEEAEGRVEILLKKADGKLVAEPFEPENESDKGDARVVDQKVLEQITRDFAPL